MSINIKELLCTTALASSFLLGVCDVSATEEKNSGDPTGEQANIALSASDATATSNQNASDQTGEQANIALSASDTTATSNQNAPDQTAGGKSETQVQSKSITQLLGELDEELTKISDSKEKKEKQNDEEIPDAFIQQMVGMNKAQIEKCWKAYCASGIRRDHHTNGRVIQDTINNNAVIKYILNDAIDDFIQISSDPTFDPNGIVYGSVLGNRTYIQLMALWGSIKCFKHAISTDLYKLKDIAPYAIAGGNMEIIHILEQKGISFDNVTDAPWVLQFITPDLLNWLPQHYEFNTNLAVINAIRSRMFKYAWALLRFAKGQNETLQYDDILVSTALAGNLSIVKYLTKECGANVESKDDWGRTPLHWASLHDRLDIVQYLTKECGANVASRDDVGNTPLHVASDDGHLSIVQYLTEKCKADVNAKNKNGETPLHLVSTECHLDIVKCLTKECECNVDSKNNDGETPLFYAAFCGELEVVKYLTKECMCDVESKNNDGVTPLHAATMEGHLEIVKYLVEECHVQITDDIIKNAWNGKIKDYLRTQKDLQSKKKK